MIRFRRVPVFLLLFMLASATAVASDLKPLQLTNLADQPGHQRSQTLLRNASPIPQLASRQCSKDCGQNSGSAVCEDNQICDCACNRQPICECR